MQSSMGIKKEAPAWQAPIVVLPLERRFVRVPITYLETGIKIIESGEVRYEASHQLMLVVLGRRDRRIGLNEHLHADDRHVPAHAMCSNAGNAEHS